MEWFLSSVDTNVGFHIELCETALVANLANKRFNPSVHRLEMFGETESVDETLHTFLADMDSSTAMYPAVPYEAFSIREVFPTESTRKRSLCEGRHGFPVQHCCRGPDHTPHIDS